MSRTDGPPLVILAGGRARRYGGVKPLAPVGPGGEAVVDLLASDALAAGFTKLVLVLGASTGPAIRYHVEHSWPPGIDVHFAEQPVPLGTVHALACASEALGAEERVGVCNADDLYGAGALRLLAAHLASDDPRNVLVAFHLRDAVVGDSPVTRGLCHVDDGGLLRSIDERRQVFAVGDDRFISKDGHAPAELPGDSLVSMNLWGFTPVMRRVLEEAVGSSRHASDETELLLPEVVATRLSVPGRPGYDPATAFVVLVAPGRCIGVTHPDDLPLVQAELARSVGAGERPAKLWQAVAR
ncbi:MAG TPA: NTP transferase domain-containing protein [Acidimicrobiales bacterium]|nr:NTP transferase domain-containing protein [Acidimicrobiales bacterium]